MNIYLRLPAVPGLSSSNLNWSTICYIITVAEKGHFRLPTSEFRLPTSDFRVFSMDNILAFDILKILEMFLLSNILIFSYTQLFFGEIISRFLKRPTSDFRLPTSDFRLQTLCKTKNSVSFCRQKEKPRKCVFLVTPSIKIQCMLRTKIRLYLEDIKQSHTS